ncbi:MAG: SDR family oxidoreductase [Desulfobacteraceae bacterium]|nr:SDR family oxidoreductase [Desulfobacteraceae bacterium]
MQNTRIALPLNCFKEQSLKYYLDNKALLDLYKHITPLKRLGTTDQVSIIIVFLCGSETSFITGQTILADGGISLQWHESQARQLTPLKDATVTRQA